MAPLPISPVSKESGCGESVLELDGMEAPSPVRPPTPLDMEETIEFNSFIHDAEDEAGTSMTTLGSAEEGGGGAGGDAASASAVAATIPATAAAAAAAAAAGEGAGQEEEDDDDDGVGAAEREKKEEKAKDDLEETDDAVMVSF
jgi:hypothetical protein